jgi:predicted aspartyl protease
MTIYDLRQVGISLLLTLGLAASSAAASPGTCRYVPVAKLALDLGPAGLRPRVRGTINGQPAMMLVDTGVERTTLMSSAAERLKIPLQASGNYVHGVGGAAVVYNARVDDFALGPARSGKVLMPVLSLSGAPRQDALVGTDFLLQMDLEVSFADRHLRFFRATGCDDTFLAYWDPEALEIPFDNGAGRAQPAFTVQLNGIDMHAIIDTGATHTTVTRKAAERAGIKPGSPQAAQAGQVVGIGDQALTMWRASFATFALGRETIADANLAIMDTAPGGQIGTVDVIIGADFLRAHRVLFAMSQRRLYISYNGGKVF